MNAAVFELFFIAGVYLVYRAGRLVTANAVDSARHNAGMIHDLEHTLHLPSEAAIQSAVGSIRIFEAANVYYVALHFPVIIGFLVWGFFGRPRPEYLWARNLLVFQTLGAVIIHIAFPLAPPRMFPDWGFVDTMTTYGPSAYGGPTATIANQYAAMPSLHAGWAILVAVVITRTGPRLLARLAQLHAVITLTVITVTANHWFVDTLVAVALLAVGLFLFPAPRERGAPDPGETEG